MKIVPIFEPKQKSVKCRLWSICKENGDDIFSDLFEKWDNDEYLADFFYDNRTLLYTDFWKERNVLSIDNAIDRVKDEVEELYMKIKDLASGANVYTNLTTIALFECLHKPGYELKKNALALRKAKAEIYKSAPLIRIYGILLDDDSLIITGGSIKLTKDMNTPILLQEKKKMEDVLSYFHSLGITDNDGLSDYYETEC